MLSLSPRLLIKFDWDLGVMVWLRLYIILGFKLYIMLDIIFCSAFRPCQDTGSLTCCLSNSTPQGHWPFKFKFPFQGPSPWPLVILSSPLNFFSNVLQL